MKKWIRVLIVIVIVLGTGVLLTAAHQRENDIKLGDPTISIAVQDEIALLTELELSKELEVNQFYYPDMTKSELDVNGIEQFLESMNEVEAADVYIDIGGQWHVDVQTRRPVARIIMNKSPDFYLDNRDKIMRISAYSKPKTLCFTGLESSFDAGVTIEALINIDSLKTKFNLDQVYRISSYVCNSAFYNAQIVQVHFSEKDGFILIPRVGSQTIIFGSAPSDEVVEQKFNKLTTFYEEVIPFEGWSKYEEINLKFDDQIVAKKK
jgi:cell division protein FtsQ